MNWMGAVEYALKKIRLPPRGRLGRTLSAISKYMSQRPLLHTHQNQVSKQYLRHLCLLGRSSCPLRLCFCICPEWCQSNSGWPSPADDSEASSHFTQRSEEQGRDSRVSSHTSHIITTEVVSPVHSSLHCRPSHRSQIPFALV